MTNKYYGNPLARGGKQRPPAEAQPNEHVEVLREMLDDAAIEPPWKPEEVAAITAAIAALSAPSAPVGVEASYHQCTSILIEGLKRLEGGGEVLAEWDRARAKTDTALAQQPAAHPAITHCDNCGLDWLDNGLNPVGCPYCKWSAWRAAFVAERATRYREGGMKIEQARIHAETDATLMEKIARQSQGGES